MTAAEATVNEGGVIIMVAKSEDGHGGQAFYETFRDEPDENRLMERFLATPADGTIPDPVSYTHLDVYKRQPLPRHAGHGVHHRGRQAVLLTDT